MTLPRLICCLDVAEDRVVKGVNFLDLRDAGDPVERAALACDTGADEIVLLDVTATTQRRNHAWETVARVRQRIDLPLTVGGGIRSIDDARRALDAGADKVAVNTAALRDPELVTVIAQSFGAQCAVVALDVARTALGFEVFAAAGTTPTGRTVAEVAATMTRAGVGELLVTSIDRDGTGTGYDLELLREVRAVTSVPIIASGGGRTVAHLAAALEAGADAVLLASLLHDTPTTPARLKAELAACGTELRR